MEEQLFDVKLTYEDGKEEIFKMDKYLYEVFAKHKCKNEEGKLVIKVEKI